MTSKPRLRDKMREDLELRGMSPATIESYLRCARRFAEYHGRSPCALGAAEIRTFLVHLVRERKVAPSSFNVYACAIKFLYAVTLDRPEVIARIPRMRVPMHLPVVLSAVEVLQLLGALTTDKHRVMVMLAYGAGLRVSEVRKLRVDDIDPKRMLIHVRHSKRGRERYVMLSSKLPRRCARTGRYRVRRARICSPDATRKSSSHGRRSTEPWSRRRGAPGSPSRSRPTRFATASPRTCSTWEPTCARCRSCWAMRRSRARWRICT
jgi:site-specific recombinase XerD